MIAKVQLNDAASYSTRGRSFVKGQPQLLSDPNEIRYFQSNGMFTVALVNENKAKATVASPAIVSAPLEAKSITKQSDELVDLPKEDTNVAEQPALVSEPATAKAPAITAKKKAIKR